MITKPERISKIDITKDNINNNEYCLKSHISHDYCKYVKSIIKDLIDDKKEINDILLHRYFKIICSSIECWTYDYDNNLLLCMSIFDKFNQSDLSDYVLDKIMDSKNGELFLLFIGSISNFTIDCANKLLNLFKYEYYSGKINNEDNYNMLESTIEKCINSNNNELMHCALNYIINDNLYITFYTKLLEKLLDLKLKPSDEQFLKLLIKSIYNPEYLYIIKKCILNGIIIEKNLIKNLMNYINNPYNFKRINYFNDICIYFYDNGSTDFIIDDIIKCSDKICNMEKFINHIIDNDYNLTKEEFKLLCSNKIFIKNNKMIEKFLDDTDIKEIIYNFNLNYKIKIEYTLNILKNECNKRNNIKKITEILKTVKPDQECLEIVCKVPNNMSVIRLIHNNNIPFNEKCILNYSYDLKHNSVLTYLRSKIEELRCDKDIK